MIRVIWANNVLRTESGEVLAHVRADVLEVGKERLLIESAVGVGLGFRMRATSTRGKIFTLTKSSVSTRVLKANCHGRRYVVQRESWRSRRRIIVNAQGEKVGVVYPRGLKEVVLETNNSVPVIDQVFLSYGVAVVDTGAGNLRY
ncbi:hypothetical protein P4N68_09975 [Corynebacterium felinum]|uniref:Uncharacterized protein n=1 Tax=Corynebacterium felinum TaxID=131318 RepID=A0ABU2BCG6_9CORY|nr:MULTISPECIES: hypothetical protein [Corynebacterium]MDF5821398.1 hypothetical protein [Corynebacterium felinum]MDO4762428.1 hypothetical protein [Corynebacterium sp.]MDR7356305.1 hypothetical protein [Corynebacterium felinum]WJY95639.1 hypothetical protein CFELI_10205 [Corynebacterium felinum]